MAPNVGTRTLSAELEDAIVITYRSDDDVDILTNSGKVIEHEPLRSNVIDFNEAKKRVKARRHNG